MGKYDLLTGRGNWFFKSDNPKYRDVVCCDGPYGVRKPININELGIDNKVVATTYPTPSCLACSFDQKLAYLVGENIAKEADYYDVDIILGPGNNIKKDPRCGRNFEYYSEDPLLSGLMAANFINGLEENGIGSSLKHLCCNNQESFRMLNDSIISEKALRDIYLKTFEYALKYSSPTSIMVSYNLLNGTYTTENTHLLQEIIRDELKFKGIFISDWGACYQRSKGIKAGLDIEMPERKRKDEYFENRLGIDFTEEDLDCCQKRIRNVIERFNKRIKKNNEIDFKKQYLVAKDACSESIVLAKNEHNFFPLAHQDKILFIGDFAINPRYQGGGSSNTNSYYAPTFIDILKQYEISFDYIRGYDKTNILLTKKEIEKLSSYSKIVIFLGVYDEDEYEGNDRENIKLRPNQYQLVDIIKQYNKNIGVVLMSGSVVSLSFNDDIKGLFITYLGGEGVCEALYEVMYGIKNPCGALQETWIKSLQENKYFEHFHENPYFSYYDDDIYVGYRYYDTFNNNGYYYRFGHGLSYSNFEVSVKKVEKETNRIKIVINVFNNSNVKGKYIAQVYIGKNDSQIYRAQKELKAFTKISLNQYENKDVELYIDIDDLKVFSNLLNRYVLEYGEYEIYVKNGLDDNYLVSKIMVEGEMIAKEDKLKLPRKDYQKQPFDENTPFFELVKDPKFVRLLEKYGIKYDEFKKSSTYDLFKDAPLRIMISLASLDEQIVEEYRKECK